MEEGHKVLLSLNSFSAVVIYLMEGSGVWSERLVQTVANKEWRLINSLFVISSFLCLCLIDSSCRTIASTLLMKGMTPVAGL